MRELISNLFLVIDEAWLTHNEAVRFKATVSIEDVHTESTLFEIEKALFETLNAVENLQRRLSRAASLLPFQADFLPKDRLKPASGRPEQEQPVGEWDEVERHGKLTGSDATTPPPNNGLIAPFRRAAA